MTSKPWLKATINLLVVKTRLRAGWDIKTALTTPVRPKGAKR